ncbi:RecX family transcriptional regulator [Candidatus Daviesbacteria bacterium]|nr:RecX family transcriptional regulator [Candidatus Daviesbacteria bacterium]
MKITSVEPQKNNPKRFNIFLDSVFGFGADEDTVVKFRLVPGKEIPQEDLDKILLETEVGKLIGRMYGWFGVRMRSEKEVRDYFRVKNQESRVKGREEVSSLLIDQVVESLKNKGMINDEVFAKSWIEARRRSKKKGLNVIKMELFQKGISREIVNEVISHQSSVTSEEKIAEEALEKKTKVWKYLPEIEFKKKATEFLMRKGFEYAVTKIVVAKFWGKE